MPLTRWRATTFIVVIWVACTRPGVNNSLGRTLLSEGPVVARYTARCKSKTRSRQTQEVLLKYHQCSFISITWHHCVNKGPCPLACPNQQQHLCPHVTTCMPNKLVWHASQGKTHMPWPCMHMWYNMLLMWCTIILCNQARKQHHISSSIMLALSKVIRRKPFWKSSKSSLFFLWKIQIWIRIRKPTQNRKSSQNIFK